MIGRHRYIHTPPNGSLIVRAYRVTITAIRIRWRLGKKHDNQHILDYAKESLLPINYGGKETVTESDQNRFINDLKQVWSVCRVFVFFPFYWICSTQVYSNFISQAAQMDVGPLPNDVFQNIVAIVVLILIPIFDKLIYPILRRLKINISPIRRITFSFVFASIGMAWAAFVQHMIYSTGPNYTYTRKLCLTCQKFNNISVAWQIPSYIVMAIAEILGSITGLEYAFTHAPASMKSIVVSLFLFTTAIGSALSFALLPLTIDPKLIWMYASLLIMAFVISVAFLRLFRKEQKKDEKLPLDK
ncbi:unnamed protein product [Rotaria sp. Silwood2]|nr:unnamed protein product [Rotaria sp. Silwood2]CAF3182959.1 unnamed protein product [Rotaria sp. Silwood2]CAF4235695.1 unnamed protein product [Rotaria sp. Silwood2]CAF4647862.1 unnamed protein product [Rotaria sp. Silwood2]